MIYEFNYLVLRLEELAHDKSQPIQAALVVNQITALMIDLELHYAHSAPLEIAKMDYLGREVVLIAQIPNDYGLYQKRISQMELTWSSLRPSVMSRNGKKVADQIDHVIDELRKEPPEPQMVKDGKRILDLVDELEKLFK